MIEKQEEFNPDWASPPGDTIADTINERGWTQVQLANRLGISKKHLNRLIQGKVALTDEMAFRLATVLGSTEQFWLRREAQYRQQLARLTAEGRYRTWHHWLEQFPLVELKRARILPNKRTTDSTKTEFVEELLRFFSIATPEQWNNNYVQMNVRFRRAQDCDFSIGAVTAWLRQGEIELEHIQKIEGYDLQYSSKKFKAAIHKIRELTVCEPEEFQQRMQTYCMNAGVNLIFVPSIPKAKISGAARWINSQSPLIQLSLFGKFNDKFWFSFFHEAAHILLHAEEKEKIYLDDKFDTNSLNTFETEANEFAENLLIPTKYKAKLDTLKSELSIKKFASEIGIHPGIVVGRLQKEKIIQFSQLNKLKVRYEFVEE